MTGFENSSHLKTMWCTDRSLHGGISGAAAPPEAAAEPADDTARTGAGVPKPATPVKAAAQAGTCRAASSR